MMSMMSQIVDTKLSTIIKNKGEDLLSAEAAEDWVADEVIREALEEPWIWYNHDEQRIEDMHEKAFRARVWSYLTRVLPNELWQSIVENDILALLRRMVLLNRSNASRQVTALRADFNKLHKGSKPMLTWLDELYAILNKLATLKKPMEVDAVKTHILMSIGKVEAYSDVVRDMRKNPNWDIATLRMHLQGAAQDADDLVPKVSKKEKKKEESKSDSTAELVLTKKEKHAVKAARKAAAAKQTAHPPPAKGAKGALSEKTAPAEGPVSTPAQKKQGEAICRYHLYGSCKKGDSCAWKHVSLADVQAMIKAAAKAKSIEEEDTPSATSVAGQGKTLQCNSWAANGTCTCTYGDSCKFLHQSPKTSKMIKSECQYSTGDVVQLLQCFANPELIGARGQVFEQEGQRVKVQFFELTKRAFLQNQAWLEWAQSRGVPAEHIVPALDVDCMGQSVKAARLQKNPFSLGAAFDTGANILLSNQTQIASGPLERLAKPEMCDGAQGNPCVITMKGPVTLYLGHGKTKVVQGHFYEGGVPETLIPAQAFDDGADYFYMGKDQAITIHDYQSEAVLARFPREIIINSETRYTPQLLRELERARSTKPGTRRHILYPVPDSIFEAARAGKALLTRAQIQAAEKADEEKTQRATRMRAKEERARAKACRSI